MRICRPGEKSIGGPKLNKKGPKTGFRPHQKTRKKNTKIWKNGKRMANFLGLFCLFGPFCPNFLGEQTSMFFQSSFSVGKLANSEGHCHYMIYQSHFRQPCFCTARCWGQMAHGLRDRRTDRLTGRQGSKQSRRQNRQTEAQEASRQTDR